MTIVCIVVIIVQLVIIATLIFNRVHFIKANHRSPVPSDLLCSGESDMDGAYQIGALGEQMNGFTDAVSTLCATIAEVQDDLPRKVLQTIQGSINPRRGKVGELVSMLQLTSEYDRIIPLGAPVDMIGISEDSIDFIEVKTGSGRLTKMELHIKELVEEGKVRVIVVSNDVEISSPEEGIDCG